MRRAAQFFPWKGMSGMGQLQRQKSKTSSAFPPARRTEEDDVERARRRILADGISEHGELAP